MQLNGRTVLLTGASGGIGEAIAHALAQRGAKLILTARRKEIIDSLAQAVGGIATVADLSSRQDVSRLIEQYSDVDVLVANAALPASGPLDDFTQEEIDRALEVNLRAPIALTHGLLPQMVARNSGHIVFINSLAGKAATVGTTLYSATKFGLRGFAEGLAADLDTSNVKVSSIFPGFISDAGLYADSGAKLPFFVGTRTPGQVAEAVVKAIESGKHSSANVAPVNVTLGATFGSVAPRTLTRLNKLGGAHKLAASISEGQRDKR